MSTITARLAPSDLRLFEALEAAIALRTGEELSTSDLLVRALECLAISEHVDIYRARYPNGDSENNRPTVKVRAAESMPPLRELAKRRASKEYVR